MGRMAFLSSQGDSEIFWDADSDKSIENAKKKFKKFLGDGYKAFRMDPKGKKRGRQIFDFPPHAGELLLIPPIVGG
jgi:hypothetical protein